MRKLAFGLLVLGVMSCTPSHPQTVQEAKAHVYDVGWTVLVRDFATAHSYTGQRVRIRIDANDYRVENGEIRVYAADNGAPPILILKGIDPLPSRPLPALIVTGVCRGPVRDGNWRSRTADYCVILTECAARAK